MPLIQIITPGVVTVSLMVQEEVYFSLWSINFNHFKLMVAGWKLLTICNKEDNMLYMSMHMWKEFIHYPSLALINHGKGCGQTRF